jgi:outer membrane lipoprotein-sorting protein
MIRTPLRWLPAVLVPLVVGTGVVVAGASPVVNLDEKSPEQVLAMVAASDVRSFSGTLQQTSRLGLPELPPTGSSPGSDEISAALELVTGSHEARVFVDGPDRARVQVMDDLAERDLIRSGSEVWTYDSDAKEATHITLPDHTAAHDTPVWTPEDLAGRALDVVTPSTEVSLGPASRVAGRSVYELMLTPRTDDTLVGSVTIAVDSETGMPLAFSIHAKGESVPALRVAFSNVDFAAPSADLFAFTPPAGTEVTNKSVAEGAIQKPSEAAEPGAAEPPFAIIGSDWSSVAALPAGSAPQQLLASPLLASVATPVDGGLLIGSALVNVLVTDDGRVFAGAVPLTVLQDAAAKR